MPRRKYTDIFINVLNDATGSQVAEGDVVKLRCTPTSSQQTCNVFLIAPAPGNAHILVHLRIDGHDFIHFKDNPPPVFKLEKAGNATLAIDPYWKWQYKIVDE